MLEQWATQLAAEIAPDEAALAPLVAQAYAAGGDQRAELFRAAQGTPGAFGAGEVLAVLPFAFKALAVTAPPLLALLSSDIVSDVVESAKTALNLAELTAGVGTRLKRHGDYAAGPNMELVRTVLTEIPHELRAAGLSEDQCNATTLRMLRVLVQDPEAGRRALTELSGN
jgi:hypothetical protein